MSKIKVGVVGVGHLGSIHSKLLSSNERVDLVGVFDQQQDRAFALAETLGVRVFDSIESLVAETDACVIASPTSIHFEQAKYCIERGKHLFIEKPMTMTAEQAREVVELKNKHSVVVQVGHVERFNPAIVVLKDRTLNPLYLEADRIHQFKPRATDVSVVLDLMIHDLDLALWLIPHDVVSVKANGVAVLTDSADIASARIEFANGAVANLTASRLGAKNFRKFRLFQSDEYVSIDFGKPSVEIFKLTDPESVKDNSPLAIQLGTIDKGTTQKTILFEVLTPVPANAIQEEHNCWIASILDGTPVAITAEESLRVLTVVDEINAEILRNAAMIWSNESRS